MRTARFEIVRVLLTVVGMVAFVLIGFELAFAGKNTTSKVFGWMVLVFLGIGLAGVFRKRRGCSR